MLKLLPVVFLVAIAQGAIITEHPQTPVNFDWDKILQCLKEAQTLVPEVLQLIEAIKTSDYGTAVSLVFKLIAEGSEVVQKCITLAEEKAPEIHSFLGRRLESNGNARKDVVLECLQKRLPKVYKEESKNKPDEEILKIFEEKHSQIFKKCSNMMP